MKKTKFSRLGAWLKAHKIVTTIIIIAIIGGGYGIYRSATKVAAATQYTLSPVTRGTLTQTVTGSGQIAAQNQLDIKSEVSGTILSIPVQVGQVVTAGTIIATIDPHDALVDLQNARISFAKLTEPAKERDISAASSTIAKSYTDAYNTISSAFLDFSPALDGLKDILNGSTGYLSSQRSTFLSQTAQNLRSSAELSYDNASAEYTALLVDYKNLSRQSPRSQIENILQRTQDLSRKISEALKNTQATIVFVTSSQPEYYPSNATSAAANVSNWSTTVNSNVANLISAENNIQNSIDSLEKLTEGADSLDIESQHLSLQEKERTYQKYFVRAPFDGVVGRIPVNIHDTASNGTVMATLASTNKITTIPLNEVDAVKVASGQKVSLTFDAISGLTVPGNVISIDQVGVSSQGVVTYNVKISLNQDDTRIKPGMSTDATITTEEKADTLLVPSSAVKTQGQQKYVEVFGASALSNRFRRNQQATTTMATSTDGSIQATSTPRFGQGGLNRGTFSGTGIAMTIGTSTLPTRVFVTVGDSNDTSTEILSGLTPGQLVVTRTVAANGTTATQSSAPSIFSSFGGGARGATGGNAVRIQR
ncbi:MAG: HlyD family efflux transporter periplasmic adaptor subunit [Patescibacteria group bacterium]